MPEQKLTADAVVETVKYCLFNEDEIVDGKAPEDAIIVDGILGSFGLHPGRVEEKKPSIIEMLQDLPSSFLKSAGGGMSFLEMCNDKHGAQWTGLHRTMSDLVVLAIAAGVGEYCMPREMWQVLPGGMPYVAFDVEEISV